MRKYCLIFFFSIFCQLLFNQLLYIAFFLNLQKKILFFKYLLSFCNFFFFFSLYMCFFFFLLNLHNVVHVTKSPLHLQLRNKWMHTKPLNLLFVFRIPRCYNLSCNFVLFDLVDGPSTFIVYLFTIF